MLILGVLTTLGAFALALWFIARGDTEIPEWASAGLAALFVPVLAVFFIRFQFWNTMANAVPVTAKQFPELHELYAALGAEMGFTGSKLQALPQLYVINGNGVLNASAAKCQVRKAYIQINSDLLDIAYELGDFRTVRFVLAHELGHVKLRHVSIWRLILGPVNTILTLRPSISRAQEYSADRVGCYYEPEGARGMAVLFAGKRMYQRVNLEEYYDSIRSHRVGLWLRAANYFADHALGFRRMAAIEQTASQGWNVHGKML
ncbi:Zn-dependent protease with chaperone function [Leucobacter luti]|uniref:Zn-dependent protease with chaperone function n=2 Tax=Leucobacter luti TaxID=340320 RepID=A0A4Q7U2Y9_9MICO|nr:M48 family peptidase [Leucobacter luti]RZT66798.1 Zn-dependent protease with chaperone function [Leucobacter luti]